MIDSIARHILALHGIVALAIVFAVPLLESSAFVGFVFPGEIAVILGGVLAFQHRVSLPAVLAAAISGAILGDTVGYWVGRRYGRRVLAGRVGRRIIRREHIDRAERYLAARGAGAVFLGRFTAALRVAIPGLAGMAHMPYRTFAAANVTGGAIWATAMVLVGYLAGASWQRAEHWASRIGLALLALILFGVAARTATAATRRRADRVRGTLHRLGDRLAATHPARWVRHRFPARVAWGRRRLDPATPAGLALTSTVALAVLLAWTFGGLTQDVAAGEGVAGLDPRVHAVAVAHRSDWLTAAMANITWLGSNWLLVPVLLLATVVLLRRRDRRAAVALWVAYLGSIALYVLAKPLVDRPRPPFADLIGQATGPSFPSGYATQALAAWVLLAVVLTAGRSVRVRAAALTGATVVVLLVGASRVYLSAHWLTDVLAGYALAATWLAVLAAMALRRARPDTGQPPDGQPDTEPGPRSSASPTSGSDHVVATAATQTRVWAWRRRRA